MQPLKLFTIGDSISQGFMSLAAARTDLCYSTIVAREMGWLAPSYNYPVWEKGGHPINLEEIFRKLNDRIGDHLNVLNLFEDLKAFNTTSEFLEDIESYYEKGAGKYDTDYCVNGGNCDYFHNVAVRGFNISDAWTVSQHMSDLRIKESKGFSSNDRLSGPSSSFFRTAARVLNARPVSKPQFNTYTALDWLAFHVKESGGVENVFMWLGANNALASITEMKMIQSPGNLPLLPKIKPETALNDPKRLDMYKAYQENKYNLWHVEDFAREYEQLLTYTDEILKDTKTKVFVATVPFVTILPLARGMGKEFEINERIYFEYYTYFPFLDDKLADNPGLRALRLSEVLFIEETIKKYNNKIKELVEKHNSGLASPRYFVVDISQRFEQMAFRRNKGVPPYIFPDYINNRYPKPDTRYYERHPTQGVKGGLFSLDGVHPTAIGQGLIAYEFMKVMMDAGIKMKSIPGQELSAAGKNTINRQVPDLDWPKIYADDSLYNKPLALVSDLFKHNKLKSLVLKHTASLSK